MLAHLVTKLNEWIIIRKVSGLGIVSLLESLLVQMYGNMVLLVSSYSMSWIKFLATRWECWLSVWTAAAGVHLWAHKENAGRVLEELLFLRWIRLISWIANSASAQRIAHIVHIPWTEKKHRSHTERHLSYLQCVYRHTLTAFWQQV